MSLGYTQFDDIFDNTAGDEVASALFRNNALGVQDQFEDRMDAWAVSGVISGMACSINGADVDVADGDAYAAGKRYSGADSYTFTASDASDTYYLYIDPTDDTTPLTRATTEPSGDELPLCSVDWNGTDTLSSIVDMRLWGIYPACYRAGVAGSVSADQIAFIPLDRNFFVEGVKASLETCGTGAGPTYIDVHGGTGGSEATIFTTQTRRVSIAHDDTDGAVVESGTPDGTRKFSAGEKLIIEVDAVATDAADLGVIVYGRYY